MAISAYGIVSRLTIVGFFSLFAVVSGMTLDQPDSSRSEGDPTTIATRTLADSTISATPRIVDTVVVIPKLDFSSLPLFEALTAISRAYNLSMYIDSSVVGTITLRLDNVSLNDALLFIIREHKLAWERTGHIIKIYKPVPVPPAPKPLKITYVNDLLSADLTSADLARVAQTVTDLTGNNVVLQNGVHGAISGKITHLKPDKALEVLLTTNGFTYTKVDNVVYVGMPADGQSGGPRARNLNVRCDSGLVSLEVTNTALAEVLPSLSRQCTISLFVQTPLEGTVTASLVSKTIEEALTYLLLTTAYSFKEINGIFFVGKRESEDLYDTRLLTVNHLIAANVEPLVPASLGKQVTLKVDKEHNGLLVTGPRTAIARIEDFLREVDIPTAQVLFEVLVVDYNTTDRAEFNLTLNNFGKDTTGKTYFPNIDLAANGKDFNEDLNSLSRHLGVSNLGTLPPDFYIRLQMMQTEGKANIRSHPKIASLNGHSASIKIGTTQYYLLKSTTIYPSQQTSISTETSERFEKVEADMSLEVTPYVNTTGELIVDVKPEFNTPAQAFNPEIPPTINRRVLNSTVRLKDGETIVLGGLVQTNKTATVDKLPILGSIPIIGRLFQNRFSVDQNSELMIYITPHVYYGSEGSIDLESVLKKK
jgi:type IV pilus assembly protein PilQ